MCSAHILIAFESLFSDHRDEISMKVYFSKEIQYICSASKRMMGKVRHESLQGAGIKNSAYLILTV